MTPAWLKPLPADASCAPTFGICEWENHYSGTEAEAGSPAIIDACFDLHRQRGFTGLVWSCGRSTIHYHSALPHTTRQAELGYLPRPGRMDASFITRVMDQVCPLRRALELGGRHGMPILGRLCMNRHYGDPRNIDSTSRFSIAHPDWIDMGKLGQPIRSRMSYAIPGVQQERLDILLELQRIGVDALVLDYCRQMPILGYHDALVQPYIRQTGIDPRMLHSTRREDHAHWFQYRANVLTQFMTRLREEVIRQQRERGKPCPIIVRIPDYQHWLLIACGLDVKRWFEDDLIDGTMLSPFPRIRDDLAGYPEEHVQLAHQYHKVCMGGVGSKGLLAINRPLSGAQVEYACDVARRQYDAGVDAMTLYQSEGLARMDYMHDMIRHLGNKTWMRQASMGASEVGPDDERYFIGKDWHARIEDEGLDVAICGNNAL